MQQAGGEMGRRFREFDWSVTPIGPPDGWPLAWRNAARLIFNSSHPLALGLGKDLIYLYNDGFISLGGPARHPSALGQPVRTVWQEIWPSILLPRFTQTLATAEPTHEEDLPMPLFRSGYLEETYISFSFAALPDDQDRPSGIFCTATENTGRVIARRQIDCLRRLAAQSASADSRESACRAAVATLEDQPRDVPFGLIYLLDSRGSHTSLAGSCGLKGLPRDVSPSMQLGSGPDPFCLAVAASRKEPVVIDGIKDLVGRSLSRENLVPQQALAIPVISAASKQPAGILVAGLNPMRPVAESREFLLLVAGQLETAIANASARHDAEERAQKLAEIDRAKTVFFSNISHELRTPLTLLLGPLDAALSIGPLGLRQRELLLTAQRAAKRLLKLVNSLLEFSRLEAGRIEASYVPVDLATLTADLASEFRSAFEQGGVALQVDCPPLPEPVYVDPDMWEKIVLNLLSNALKFTLTGTVTIRLHARDLSVRLQVVDSGCGISEDDLPHLFERFYRGQATQARSAEGTGIGLSLVQELVKLHGGTIEASSRIGHGTAITLDVPLGSGHLPSDRIGASHTLPSLHTGTAPFIDEALGWRSPAGASTHPEGPPLRPEDCGRVPIPPGRSERILVVDDNRDMRDYVRHMLEQRYQVDTVPDGQSALARVRDQHYDLMILDIMMPSMNGFELLKSLRADSATEDMAVILVSARAGQEAAAEGLHAGADDYLAKPFSHRELLARVENRLILVRLCAAARLARQRVEAALGGHANQYSALTHDLRSPLHTAFMCLTLLQQQDTKTAQRKTLATLERSLDSLREHVEAMLEQVKAASVDQPDPK